MGEEINIYMAFLVWHFQIALPSFCEIPINASIIIICFSPFVQRTPAALI